MVWWKEYILSVIGCVLFSGIISQIALDLRYKKMIHMACSVLVTIVILGPLTSFKIKDALKFEMEIYSPDIYLDIGKQTAQITREECIKSACESYIANKANGLGLEVTSEVFLNENLIPYFVRIYGQADADAEHCLKELLEKDLGITKENQVWIWNQEKGS